MRSIKLVVCLCVLMWSLTNLAQTDPQPQSLGEAARALRQQKHQSSNQEGGMQLGAAPANLQPEQSLGDLARRVREKKEAQSGFTSDAERTYRASIRDLLTREDFAALDEAAAHARTTKSRLPGGIWNLLVFYETTGVPPNGEHDSDAQWQAHVGLLKRWVERRPDSVTARIALADSYLNYGWKARGGGYSDTVTDDGWNALHQRMEKAAATLMEASKLPTKDPYWFEVMQALLRTAGIEKDKMEELFEAAIKSEPSYYHFYREQATYLLPKWGGEPGDAEAFAEETYKRVGGKEGAFLYFEIASVIYCDCSNEPTPLKLSWNRIQEGYAFMAATWGTSNLKRNRMALLALQAGDRTVAHQMFTEIREAWDPGTWRSKARFEQVSLWAQ